LIYNAMIKMGNECSSFFNGNETYQHTLRQYWRRQMFRTRARRAPATSSLEQAISRAHTDTIKSLIAHGEDINAINIRGHAPIHLATAKGNSDVVKLLLENGADVNVAGTESGCTSLHYAASLGYVDLCELLVRYGAEAGAQTAKLETPVHLAVARGHTEVVEILLKYNARLDIRDKNGMTPLQLAENIKNWEIATLIKQHLTELWPYLLISRR
jgi:26S proteasome non-ATPase regulatory subunit 10